MGKLSIHPQRFIGGLHTAVDQTLNVFSRKSSLWIRIKRIKRPESVVG